MFKKTLLFFLPVGVFMSTFIALFDFELYQVKVLREILAMVMIIGWLGITLLPMDLYYPGKKIRFGFAKNFLLKFIVSITLVWNMLETDEFSQSLAEGSLFSLILILFVLTIIIYPFVKFEE